ncbi:hypothetical protein BDV97DRAFT_149754 [Delphinella strobiligena]|nr:hypothetical protein BDV97DRAFT_149754 [Delphinella strobiligena]
MGIICFGARLDRRLRGYAKSVKELQGTSRRLVRERRRFNDGARRYRKRLRNLREPLVKLAASTAVPDPIPYFKAFHACIIFSGRFAYLLYSQLVFRANRVEFTDETFLNCDSVPHTACGGYSSPFIFLSGSCDRVSAQQSAQDKGKTFFMCHERCSDERVVSTKFDWLVIKR